MRMVFQLIEIEAATEIKGSGGSSRVFAFCSSRRSTPQEDVPPIVESERRLSMILKESGCQTMNEEPP
jgi:hypothetical protein